MAYNYCIDHRTGITYVYDVEKQIDETTGKKVNKRKLIGKLDEAGNIVPTSGRRGRLPKKREPVYANEAEYLETITSLKAEIAELNRTIAELRKEKSFLINSMKGILAQVRE